MEKPNIEDIYNDIQGKYDLPEFSFLSKYFEIDSIEFHDPLLREIRKKIVDKLDFFIKILEDLLNPDATVIGMHECNVFDDKDKKSIFDLFSRLMVFHRDSLILAVNDDEKNEAAFIQTISGEWKDIAKNLTDIIQKLSKSWKEDIDIKEKLGYLG